jgi:hypothetical protein
LDPNFIPIPDPGVFLRHQIPDPQHCI